ncbi:MAG: glycosyltransferase [Candidatus Omnitrophica bacterium]|nr:glycosyltransferase [Candidatus Omnitrophota bacterium]
MKILMMTNTYAPMVGGIEESIRSFTREFERLGHEVVIVAPECEGAPPDEAGVIRLKAIQKFNHSEFSIALPMSSLLPELMKTFMPDIIHCHHPFWMGDIALRLSSQFRIPLVFTYHTMFEHHMHYLPIQNEGIKRFIIELFTGYANLATQVIVPSESVRAILLARGVQAPMTVAPTGVDLEKYSKGDGSVIRKRSGIPSDAVVIGYVGRLALEKNLEFLSRCVAAYLKNEPKSHFLVAGEGPLGDLVKKIFDEQGVGKRLHLAGSLNGQDLVDCYHAMNIFAFASLSETQGIVLVEAMAAGLPVVAIDAPGVREVVKDGYNGRLIFEENQNYYLEALSWCLKQAPGEFERMKKNARATTKEFAVDLCANRMLEIYQEVRVKEYASPDYKNSAWGSLADRLKNEWEMFKNMMQSGGAAMADTTSSEKPIRKKTKGLFLILPRLLSLSEWSARLLRLPRIEGAETEPGLVLIQIDGFSWQQLNKAFAEKKMPFLKGLFQKEYYQLYPHYSGLPSSTPSVQGELFYGIKQIVPAFAFLDREKGKIFRMYDSKAVLEIERRLAKQGQGLLEGGSSYSNIYLGGAQESHFCATSLGWRNIWKEANPVNFVILAFTHLPSVVRMFVLTLWEIILGIVDFGRGILKGENFQKEFKFISLRALICVLLRELVTLGVKIDIARGLPVIHLNLLGYDENAHHGGPSSRSAHWALKGIDRAIEKIYRKAVHSPRRSYDVWIYSDHGQEDAVSYVTQYGKTVEEAVAEVFKELDATVEFFPFLNKTGVQLQRARLLGLPLIEKDFNNTNADHEGPPEKKIVVTAIGPTGNIYLPREMSKVDKHQFAKALVDKAKIPVVMLPKEQGQVRVWTEEGEFNLPQDAKKILGEGHPFLTQVTEDLIHICHHPNAGEFTFMGFKPGLKPMTFPLENGSHAGPGPEETNGFALLPIDIIPRQRGKAYVTPTDLRFASLRFLKRPMPQELKLYSEILMHEKSKVDSDTIRIMTYNVHSCIGMDGKISPQRIARVIGRHNPDIVALQELDKGRKRTGKEDQPHLIAKELEMIYHFHPSVVDDEERYGTAVLSRYPMELIRAGRLPGNIKKPTMEPRGAIWAAIHIAGTNINVINTHLGLSPRERNSQIKVLLGPEWVLHPACQGPVILCGDFNALPNSQLCRHIKKMFRDAQEKLDNHNPKATWFSYYPIGRIDHIFVGPEIEVTHVEVSRTDLDKLASDHLPLIVDVKLSASSRNEAALNNSKSTGHDQSVQT